MGDVRQIPSPPAPWLRRGRPTILPAKHRHLGSPVLETHGPLGTLWTGLGLMAFYIALIWINTLLGFFLTPLFIVPATWLMDRAGLRKRPKA